MAFQTSPIIMNIICFNPQYHKSIPYYNIFKVIIWNQQTEYLNNTGLIRVSIPCVGLYVPDHHSVLTTTAFMVRKRFNVMEPQTDIYLL
jgi:hypothetical protein